MEKRRSGLGITHPWRTLLGVFASAAGHKGHEDAFFFSSRRRHTRLQGDWSSDVCSSDLLDYLKEEAWKGTSRIVVGGGFSDSKAGLMAMARTQLLLRAEGMKVELVPITHHPDEAGLLRSEERRVGKEGGARSTRNHHTET